MITSSYAIARKVKGWSKERFKNLLISMLLLLIGSAFLDAKGFSGVVFCLLLTIVMLVFLVTIGQQRRVLILGLAIVVPTTILSWVGYVTNSYSVFLAHSFLIVTFFIYAAYQILSSILDDRQVTHDTICGAVCVYLLAAFAWAYLFSMMQLLDAGSFQFVTTTSIKGKLISGTPSFLDNVYFSFVTMTTLGYGDVIPISAPARTASYLQAVFGQFYMAILVARLVSLHNLQIKHDQL